jgi:UDP-2-acetamido-2,6-beta-L-arabino-hexul-4-ose reductase
MTIGLNGNGFIGYHLWIYFTYKCKNIKVIRLKKSLFEDLNNLNKCDVVIHMAEKNRGNEVDIYENNIKSASDLTIALDTINKQPLIIYTSSIHENADNVYGKWRRKNKIIFSNWAKDNNFISITLPNIFGPFCKPNYNSFIATICDSLIKGNDFKVNDSNINLLYVENLCIQIHDIIQKTRTCIESDVHSNINDIVKTLTRFHDEYYKKGHIPHIANELELNLFTVFRSYIPDSNRKFQIKHVSDDRGDLKELVISKEKGQIFYSTTKPNVTRGNHFHTKRIERFCILRGYAKIEMRKIGSDEVISYHIKDSDNYVIDMSPYYTHSLTNIGTDDLICAFWMNDILHEQLIDDTYFENVQ